MNQKEFIIIFEIVSFRKSIKKLWTQALLFVIEYA